MTITAAQVRGARAMLNILQGDLASSAGLSRRALATFEAGGSHPRTATLARLREVLEASGVVFIETEAGAGVILPFLKGE